MKLNKPTPKPPTQCSSCQNPLTPQNTNTLLTSCTHNQIHQHTYCPQCWQYTTINPTCPCGATTLDWATHTPTQTQTSW